MKTLTTLKTKPRVRRASMSAKQVHLIARALSDPRRFEIFQLIAATSEHIGCTDLREAVDITPATMSHHLKELEAAGLIDVVRDGKFMNISFRRVTWQAYLAELQKL